MSDIAWARRVERTETRAGELEQGVQEVDEKRMKACGSRVVVVGLNWLRGLLVRAAWVEERQSLVADWQVPFCYPRRPRINSSFKSKVVLAHRPVIPSYPSIYHTRTHLRTFLAYIHYSEHSFISSPNTLHDRPYSIFLPVLVQSLLCLFCM